jgi:hypothetical protein
MSNAVGLAITTSGTKQTDTHVHVLQSGSPHQEFAGLMQVLAAAEERNATAGPQGPQPSEETAEEESTESSSGPQPAVSSPGEKILVAPQPKHVRETNSKPQRLQIAGNDEVKGSRKKQADPVVKTAQSKAKNLIVNPSAIDVAVLAPPPRLSSLPENGLTAPIQLLSAAQTGSRPHDPSYELALKNGDTAPRTSDEGAKATVTESRLPLGLSLADKSASTSLETAGSTHARPAHPAHESSTGSEYGAAVQPGDGRRQFGATVPNKPDQDGTQPGNREPATSASQSEVTHAATGKRTPSTDARRTEKTVAEVTPVKTVPGQIQAEPTSEGVSIPSGVAGAESGQASAGGAAPDPGSSPLPNKTTSRAEGTSKGRSIGVDRVDSAATPTAIESTAPSRELSTGQIPLHSDSFNGVHGNVAMPGSGSAQGQETFEALDSGSQRTGAVWTRTEAHTAEAGYQDPTLGWVGVRAEIEHGGVHAAVVPVSDSASQALSGHLSGLSSYLAERHVPVETLSVSAPESQLDGQGAATQGGNKGGHGANDQSQPSARQNAPESERTYTPDPPARTAEVGLSTPSSQVDRSRNGAHISVIA